MGNVFNAISNLSNNIFGPSKVGVTGAPSSFPPARTPIELAGDQGPLESLNRDPFSGRFLSYPSNLINDVSVGHYILFFMNKQIKTKFPYTNKDGVEIKGKTIVSQSNIGFNEGQIDPGLARAAGVEEKQIETIIGGGAIEGQQTFESDFFDTSFNSDTTILKPEQSVNTAGNKIGTGALRDLKTTTRTQDSIAIYLPPNVQDTYTTTYTPMATGLLGFIAASGLGFAEAYRNNDFRKAAESAFGLVGGAFEEMFKNAVASVTEMATQAEGGYELFNKVFGRAANPYLEVLFQGPELRSFNYSFTFAPTSEEEQREVRDIIKLFRYHQAPESRSAASLFLGLPSTFDIMYMYQPDTTQSNRIEAHENQFYHKIATCVLQSVNVDYTPGKVASHQQGAPVLIKMTLSFMETEILTKQHILAGY